MFRRRQKGFSLAELAVVLLIVGLLVGSLAVPLSVQRENARVRDGQLQLTAVREAVEGFALANGYLPCPATPSSSGYDDSSGGICTVQHGFLPATTLDITGVRNADSLLLDPWGAPIRYSVTASDVDGDGIWDFTNPGEMSDVTMPVLQPDLVVCSAAAGSSSTACSGAGTTLSDRSPMIVYSQGKDWASFSSADQLENVGTSLGGGPSGTSYSIAADRVFVSTRFSEVAGSEFDDLVVWLSANRLYRLMVESGQLP